MKFKTCPMEDLILCRSAPSREIPSRHRAFRPGEQVSLHIDGKALHEELHAEVLANGENLLVRALHSVYASPTQCLVSRGAEFEVSRDKVFHVLIPD